MPESHANSPNSLCPELSQSVSHDWCADTVLPEFVEYLSLLPNLHTIQIARVPYSSIDGNGRPSGQDPFSRAVLGRKFPSVRTLVLAIHAAALIPCCLNVESLTCCPFQSAPGVVMVQSISNWTPSAIHRKSCTPTPYAHLFFASPGGIRERFVPIPSVAGPPPLLKRIPSPSQP